jgi:enamine deaminase RidA (YjgF/YER057c/UK114 family)
VNQPGTIRRVASGAPWEPIFGYSRAVKAGGWVAVSGTTSFDGNGRIIGYGQMYVQARQAIANIAAALERAGATLGDVVRTRVFATDLTRFAEIARAHRESFGAAPPTSTAVEVRRLVHPDMLVEIEADAYLAAAREDAGTDPRPVARQRKPKVARTARGVKARPGTGKPREKAGGKPRGKTRAGR